MFEPFGTSEAQFGYLVAHGTRVRGVPGTTIIKGGEKNNNVVLLITGQATATARVSMKGGPKKGKVVCRYVGRLTDAEPLQTDDDEDGDVIDADSLVPMRGSLIAGSSLADEAVMSQLYPNDVVAQTEGEWIEWDRQELADILDSSRRALQAAFYHTLYVELVGTLTVQRAVDWKLGSLATMQLVTPEKDKKKKEDKKDNVVPAPTRQQLFSLSMFVAVPFFGFGFADNFVMIVCGDFIDAQLGVKIGISTMAAAGIGNWISDCVGLSLGDAIERGAVRMGLTNGGLTKRQEGLQVAKMVTLMSRIIGISLGCFLGMFPLLFFAKHRIEFAKEDLEIFDTIFSPSGVSTHTFQDLMEAGTKKTASVGSCLVEGNQPLDRVYLLLKGAVQATDANKAADATTSVYSGRLEDRSRLTQEMAALTHRGSIVGGSALHNKEIRNGPYPNNVTATTDIEWIEWPFEELNTIMEKEKTVQASFYSILYGEILQTLQDGQSKQRTGQYGTILAACLADGRVHVTQRRLLEDARHRLGISDEEHDEMLHDLGWSHDDWLRGVHTQEVVSAGDSAAKLEQAMTQIGEVVHSLRAA